MGIWILGIVFPWAMGRGAARQSHLATQLDASRHELAQQALLSSGAGSRATSTTWSGMGSPP